MIHSTSQQSGMVLLTPLLVFTALCLITLGALTQRNQQASMQTHRYLLHQQLHWHAVSALERAMALLEENAEPTPATIAYAERMAPIFVEFDPMDDEPDPYGDVTLDVRVVCAIQPASAHTIQAMNAFIDDAATSDRVFILTAEATIDYRGGELIRRAARIGYPLPSGRWQWILLAL